MKKAEVDANRRAEILARAKLVPKGCCHFCGYRLGTKGALWCATDCAVEYEKERVDLLEPKTLVLGVLKGEEAVPVVSTNRLGSIDDGALQMISPDLLTYYQRLDRAVRVFLTQSQIDQIRDGVQVGMVR
jgi:hypothetical protein